MKRFQHALRRRGLGAFLAAGTLCQFGGCEIGEITTTSTVDGRELIISILNSAILTPIDQFITNAINDAFTSEN